MPQRYYAITPNQGCNLYLSYSNVGLPNIPTILGPSNLAQLGIKPGIKMRGNLNTEWLFVLMGPAAPALVPGTAVNVNASTFTIDAGTGGISGTPLVAVPSGATTQGWGVWVEVTGQTLNTSPAAMAGDGLPDSSIMQTDAIPVPPPVDAAAPAARRRATA